MNLKKIYSPIKKELADVERVLKNRLSCSKHKSILEMCSHSIDAGGKRLRPVLVLLCAKLSEWSSSQKYKAINIAAAMELIHIASLVHDDIIDHSKLRHDKPTVNSRRGEDVAIALGDYFYATAMELIATCGNAGVLECISVATKTMCEGELLQVCERDNLNLSKERYLVIIKKKTAALFASSCQAGGLVFGARSNLQNILKEYGFNFGIAYQIVDDCMDFIGRKESLGKYPGTDFKMGELTLPMLNLLSQTKRKAKILNLLESPDRIKAFTQIRQHFLTSRAFEKTKKDVLFYISKAKKSLEDLDDSRFKNSLSTLADYVGKRMEI